MRTIAYKVVPCLFLLLIVRPPCMAETVRDRAARHFDSISWASNPDMLQAAPLVPISVPGANEVFPALTPTGDSGLPAVYPQIEGIGPIEYGETDGELLSFLQGLATSLRERQIDDKQCEPDRAFLSRLTVYRLENIPKPEQVYFSRPRENPDGTRTTDFALICKKGAERKSVRLEVTANKTGGAWLAHDIRLDGESYAAVAQQD